jgi:hypothetical protein
MTLRAGFIATTNWSSDSCRTIVFQDSTPGRRGFASPVKQPDMRVSQAVHLTALAVRRTSINSSDSRSDYKWNLGSDTT